MTMAKYIMQILRTELMVMLSWGFHSAYAIENGLAFYVNGYLYKGKVEVEYDEGWDLFSVRTLNPDGSTKEEQEGIYVDGLVDCVDRLVEYCPDYEKRVRETYSI